MWFKCPLSSIVITNNQWWKEKGCINTARNTYILGFEVGFRCSVFSTLWLSIRLRTRSMSPCTGWSSASWGSTLYSQSIRAWRASVNWPENKRASSSLFCLQERTNHSQWVKRPLEILQIVWWDKIRQQTWEDVYVPFYRLAADSVPFVSQFTQHVVQFLIIILKGGLVFQRPPCPSSGVVYWVFAPQSFLELLYCRNIWSEIPSQLSHMSKTAK